MCLGQLTMLQAMEEFPNTLLITCACLISLQCGSEPSRHGSCYSETEPVGKKLRQPVNIIVFLETSH
jgi:hypothetical protein